MSNTECSTRDRVPRGVRVPRLIAVVSLVSAIVLAIRADGQEQRFPGRDAQRAPVIARGSPDSLDVLLSIADVANPSIKAANDLALAARARVRGAATRPDPMLMLGAINVPVRSLNFSEDEMTMKMVGIEQSFPYPGKLGLRRRIAELQAIAARESAESVRLGVFRDIKRSWYELGYSNTAVDIAKRKAAVIGGIASVAMSRYSAGVGMQADVLRARLEATRLNESSNGLVEGRAAIAARLNELLDRPTETTVTKPFIPQKLFRAALDSNRSALFVSRELGASVEGSPLPPLSELQALAVELNPGLRAKSVMVAAGNAELELARKDHLPDIDVSLQYGQRSGDMMTPEGMRTSRSDMISAVVSIPVPINRKNKQGAEVAAVRATASSMLSEQKAARNEIRAEVARLYSDISHQRTLLALFVTSVIPQGRAAVSSAMANYQAGKGDLTSLLAAQTAVFDLELGYQRALADFGQKIAELESVVGRELIS